MPDLEGDVEFGEILLILVIFLFVGYLIYKGFSSLADLLKNFHLPKLSDLFNFNPGRGSNSCSPVTVTDGGAARNGSQTGGTANTDANIKLEIGQGVPATAAGADASCGGAQANCCTGNFCACQ